MFYKKLFLKIFTRGEEIDYVRNWHISRQLFFQRKIDYHFLEIYRL